MLGSFSNNAFIKLFTCAIATTTLTACGGGSGGGATNATNNANGLVDGAQGCAYLLEAPFSISADELN